MYKTIGSYASRRLSVLPITEDVSFFRRTSCAAACLGQPAVLDNLNLTDPATTGLPRRSLPTVGKGDILGEAFRRTPRQPVSYSVNLYRRTF